MTRVMLAALSCLLVSCQSTRNPPIMDPQAYAYVVSVVVDERMPELLEPEVTRGKGKGAAEGASRGFGGCIRSGADSNSRFGAVFMVLISPVCALTGSVVGAVKTKSADQVDQRITSTQTSMQAHASRQHVAESLVTALGPLAKYDPATKRLQPLQDPGTAELKPASLTLTVGDVGLTGKGLDPPLNLALVMHVCVRDTSGDVMLVSQVLHVRGPARKLEKWATQDEDAWTHDVAALTDAVVADTSRLLKRATYQDAERECPVIAAAEATQ